MSATGYFFFCFIAIATAWRCGFPAFISILMFFDTVFWLFPFWSGIFIPHHDEPPNIDLTSSRPGLPSMTRRGLSPCQP